MAPGVLTTLSFEDSAIDARALQLEGQGVRVKLVDVGERSILIRPLVELAQGERLLLRVPFTDGRAPTQATFALVSHPSEVDFQLEIVREAQSAEACQGELHDAKAQLAEKEAELQALRARAGVNGPAGLVLAGLIDSDGVKAMSSAGCDSPDAQGALRVMTLTGVVSYRAAAWAAVAVEVSNTGDRPWKPGAAGLLSMKTGKAVTVASLSMEQQQVPPGESALLVVETEAPPANAGAEFRLELFGADGARDLSISGVEIHNPEVGMGEGQKP